MGRKTEQGVDMTFFDKAVKTLEAFDYKHLDYSIYAYDPESPEYEANPQIAIGVAQDRADPNALHVTFYGGEADWQTSPVIVTNDSWELFVGMIRVFREINRHQRVATLPEAAPTQA